MKFLPFLAGLALFTANGLGESTGDDSEFIQNEFLRLGIARNAGGSIFFLSSAEAPDRNLLNHRDKGRFIQQSYYGEKDGSFWAKEPWRWNPVQGGGYQDQPARVLDWKKGRDELIVRSRPKHWATGEDLPETEMSSRIRLLGDLAEVEFHFRYDGKQEHPVRHQEMPAVFVDYALSTLVFYQGQEPWTKGALQTKIPGWPNERIEADENWVAYVDDSGHGLGVYFPGTRDVTCYRFTGNGVGGPTSTACSYFAPIRSLAIVPGFDLTYRIYLTIGNADQIRSRFERLRQKSEL